jgi:hypothetical protein
MVTREQLNYKKDQLEQAKKQEAGIVDKYSTNYKDWVKACERVNKLKREYNKLSTTWNFEHGCTGVGVIVV